MFTARTDPQGGPQECHRPSDITSPAPLSNNSECPPPAPPRQYCIHFLYCFMFIQKCALIIIYLFHETFSVWVIILK